MFSVQRKGRGTVDFNFYKFRLFLKNIEYTIPYNEINYIDDVLLDEFDFCDLVDVSDNDKRECNVDFSFYMGDELISEFDVFKEQLLLFL